MKKPRQKSVFMRAMSYFKPLLWRIIVVMVCGVIGIALYSFMPGLTADALDTFEELGLNHDLSIVLQPLILYLVLCILSECFDLVCRCLIIKYEYDITLNIVDQARHKLDVLPLSHIEKFEISKTTHQISVGRKLLQQCLAMYYQICRTIFFFVLNIVMMVSLNFTLSLIVMLSLPVTLIIAKIVMQKTQKFYTAREDENGQIYNFTEQHASLHGFFHENGIVGKDEFTSVNKIEGTVGVDTVVGLNESYINFISNFMYLAITVVFGILAINGSLSMADFAILPAFLLYSSRFLSNTKIITTVSNVVQPTESYAKVFFGIIDCPDDVTADEDINIKKIDGSIVFENVSTEKVKDVSFEIPFGKSVAFLEEESGTGAEIVHLMTKLELPKHGQIKVNDINLARIRSKKFYERVGMCFDHPFLIDATIAENIMYGVGKTLPENVIQAAKMFGFDEFIRALPNGYNTRLTENTVMLTNAEQQAVNLARTVLHAPDLLILNRALNCFDVVAEKKCNDIIINKLKNRTRVFVTTQVKAIQNVDCIYVCKGGRIVESGTHAELMALQGEYYRRYQS
ncbi:MAG: ABC transporter ATP-binding protein [Clostridia bacterium]|nr:ABC transporter ATP-binding protein [Clostridia bacterium]